MISDVVSYFQQRWPRPAPGQSFDAAAQEFLFPFTLSTPFEPFQQLLAVLPPSSSVLLPAPFRPLMLDRASPLADFFPAELKTDLHDKRNEWEAVVLLPFIDQDRLVAAMAPLAAALTPDEKARNRLRTGATVYSLASRHGRPAAGKSQGGIWGGWARTQRVCEVGRGGVGRGGVGRGGVGWGEQKTADVNRKR